jgi:hypothetical protein
MTLLLCRIRQHTSAYGMCKLLSSRSPDAPHTSAYISIRQPDASIRLHTSAYAMCKLLSSRSVYDPPAYVVRIRQHTSAYVSIRQHTPAYVRCVSSCCCAVYKTLLLAYVSIRQHTSAYVSILVVALYIRHSGCAVQERQLVTSDESVCY